MIKCICGYDAVYIVNNEVGLCTNCLINSVSDYKVVTAKMIERNEENKSLIERMRQLGVVEDNV